MYIQWFVKGISSTDDVGNPIMSKSKAFDMINNGDGIFSNWWRNISGGCISPNLVQGVLNACNLDRHVHDYQKYGPSTPFISVATGCVERDVFYEENKVYSAVDVALEFATASFTRAGALFIGWTVVSGNPAVAISSVAEAIRDLNVYHRWSPFQLEGEVTAKVHIPANQIKTVEWWDPKSDKNNPADVFSNSNFISPTPVLNQKGYF